MYFQNHSFLNFAWHSLTTGQQDLIKVKYYLAKNQETSLEQLIVGIEKLKLSEPFLRSEIRIHKMLTYEIPVIIKNIETATPD
jgi:hypothetical protein